MTCLVTVPAANRPLATAVYPVTGEPFATAAPQLTVTAIAVASRLTRLTDTPGGLPGTEASRDADVVVGATEPLETGFSTSPPLFPGLDGGPAGGRG